MAQREKELNAGGWARFRNGSASRELLVRTIDFSTSIFDPHGVRTTKICQIEKIEAGSGRHFAARKEPEEEQRCVVAGDGADVGGRGLTRPEAEGAEHLASDARGSGGRRGADADAVGGDVLQGDGLDAEVERLWVTQLVPRKAPL